MTPRLPWNVVWITGASTGIGREIALQLAACGVVVAASARSVEKLGELGPAIRAYPLDVTDLGAVSAAVEKIERDLGPIDMAILCAGTYSPVAIERFEPAVFERTMTSNYFGVVNCLSLIHI